MSKITKLENGDINITLTGEEFTSLHKLSGVLNKPRQKEFRLTDDQAYHIHMLYFEMQKWKDSRI